MFLTSPAAIMSPIRGSFVTVHAVPGDLMRAHQRRVAVRLVRRQLVAARVVQLQIFGDALVDSSHGARR